MDTFSPILDEVQRDITVSGSLDIGKGGNPVSIIVEDEITGEVFEVNHVKVGLVIVEDSRISGSGWLSMGIGKMEKLAEVLKFLAKVTLDGLKKMV